MCPILGHFNITDQKFDPEGLDFATIESIIQNRLQNNYSMGSIISEFDSIFENQ